MYCTIVWYLLYIVKEKNSMHMIYVDIDGQVKEIFMKVR